MSRTIEILIDTKGQATVQTRGFTGPSCKDASRFLEEALGEKTGERLTAEFYQQAAAQQHEQQRQ